MNRMVNLPVDEKIGERLHALAAQKQTDISTLLEGLLEQTPPADEYPSKFKTPEERRAALRQFIGVFDDDVTDLSVTVLNSVR